MIILERKLLMKEGKTNHVLLVTDSSLRKFNVAEIQVYKNINLGKANYTFPIMVNETKAREAYDSI